MTSILYGCVCFCFKQKTAYEMRISDWSSDVCSSDLLRDVPFALVALNEDRDGARVAPPFIARLGLEHTALYTDPGGAVQRALEEIGRESCRERVCQYV